MSKLKICGICLSGNIGKKFHEGDFDRRFRKGHKLMGINTCLDCGSDDIYTVKNLLGKAWKEGYRKGSQDMFREISSEARRAGDLYKWVYDTQEEINRQNNKEICEEIKF
jgi:hypothetical protein